MPYTGGLFFMQYCNKDTVNVPKLAVVQQFKPINIFHNQKTLSLISTLTLEIMATARTIISLSSNPASATVQGSNFCALQTHCHAWSSVHTNGHSADKRLLSWCQLQDQALPELPVSTLLKMTKMKDFKKTLSPSEHQTNPSSVLSQSGRESAPRQRKKLHYQIMT